jgi:hypothetical protein
MNLVDFHHEKIGLKILDQGDIHGRSSLIANQEVREGGE